MATFLVDVLGLDPSLARIIQVIAAFALVVAAIALAIWGISRLMRRMRGDDGYAPARIRIAEVVPVDDRRRLVLVRRDDVEHLVMIGGANDLVIEAAIRRAPAARPAAAEPAAAEPRRPPPSSAPAAPPARTEPSLPRLEPAPPRPQRDRVEPAAEPHRAEPGMEPLDAEPGRLRDGIVRPPERS
jgi:flagellar protein FliO/FliZ